MFSKIAVFFLSLILCSSALADRPPTGPELDAWTIIHDSLQAKFSEMVAAANGAGSTIAMGHNQIDQHEFASNWDYTNPERRSQLETIYSSYVSLSLEIVDQGDVFMAIACDPGSYDSLSKSMGDMIELGAECEADEASMIEIASQANAVIIAEQSDWVNWNSWW